MAQPIDDELMGDFIPLEGGLPFEEHGMVDDSSGLSAKAHFHDIHPEVEVYDFKCVCGRYFKAKPDMRAHQKATGHGACVCGENFSTYSKLHRHRYEQVHFIRCTCDRIFGSTQHLLSHQRLEDHTGFRDTKNGPLKKAAQESDTLDEVLCPCGGQLKDSLNSTGDGEPLRCECDRIFQDGYGPPRDSYGANTTGFSCRNCKRPFRTWDDMWHHQLFIHHPCIACHNIFVCESRLMKHQRETGHCYCTNCDEHFMTPDRLRQHLLEVHHISRAEIFQDVLDERPLDISGGRQVFKGGFKSGANFLHINLRCRVCGQEFTSPKTLHDHRTRGWHDPFTKVGCPFGCDERQFPSVSALLHHLEHGGCESGISTPDLNKVMRGTELELFILPHYHLQPTPESPVIQKDFDLEAIIAMAMATNNQEPSEELPLWCPFCPLGRTYPTKPQLKAHLSMYNHTPKFLAYPSYLVLPPTKSKRKADFNSWSGLAHSLETLLCAGEVEGVQQALDCIENRLSVLGMEEADIMMD